MKSIIESQRFALQQELDSQKTQEERNVLGQFSTPYELAHDMMSYLKEVGCDSSSFLEPAIGTGVFYSAYLDVFGNYAHRALGFEVDNHYFEPTSSLWNEFPLQLRKADFLSVQPEQEKFSLLVANPPYSRHHHIDTERKKILQSIVLHETGIKISGLAGLYCYFLILSTKWLKKGAISMWLIPSEFMDVNYGEAIKRYLKEKVKLVRIHRFLPEDVQFSDALVTSSIVIFKNETPDESQVVFSEGGTLLMPKCVYNVPCSQLDTKTKWSSLFMDDRVQNVDRSSVLGDFFKVSRGLATGDNDFFVLTAEKVKEWGIPSDFLVPVLPAPRNMSENRVDEDLVRHNSLFIFQCSWSEDALKKKHPQVWRYIEYGKSNDVDKGYICSHRPIWYCCERRDPAPFVMPYMGRSASEDNLFRFILNTTSAIVTNGYLMLYPKAEYADALKDQSIRMKVWNILNSVPKNHFTRKGRVYGGGLHKMEPKELMSVPMPELKDLLGSYSKQLELDFFSA